MKVELEYIKHSIDNYSKDYDEKRIGQTYFIHQTLMNHPVLFVCDDDDYAGFVTTRLQRRRRKNNTLELTTANSTYVLKIKEE